MSRPLVSIVIPVYNVESYLRECLDSVIGQTFRNIEIICVNDGSTDGSGTILSEYAAREPRMKVISQANAGLSAARNAGMDAATGKYIYFLDSDDYVMRKMIERSVEICERDQLDQLIFESEVIFENVGFSENQRKKKVRHYCVPEEFAGTIWSGAELLERLQNVRRYCVNVQTRLFLFEALRRTGLRFEKGLLHEDQLFTPLTLMESERVEVLCEKLHVRRFRRGSIVTSTGILADARRFASRVLIFIRLKRNFTERGYEERWPAIVDKRLHAEHGGIVSRARPMVVVCALFLIPDTATSGERIGVLYLSVLLSGYNVVRRIKRLLFG